MFETLEESAKFMVIIAGMPVTPKLKGRSTGAPHHAVQAGVRDVVLRDRIHLYISSCGRLHGDEQVPPRIAKIAIPTIEMKTFLLRTPASAIDSIFIDNRIKS